VKNLENFFLVSFDELRASKRDVIFCSPRIQYLLLIAEKFYGCSPDWSAGVIATCSTANSLLLLRDKYLSQLSGGIRAKGPRKDHFQQNGLSGESFWRAA
jgi:hypothetical protein